MQNDLDLRLKAGASVRKWAEILSIKLSADDAWRLLLAGALSVMFTELGDARTVETLRELASDIETGKRKPN